MRLLAPLVLCLAITSLPATLLAQDPAAFYEEHCAACHTIGDGPLGGPDLKGVTARRDREWLIDFLLDPEAFEHDPVVERMIAEADGMEMPKTEGLTRQLAGSILSHIEQRSGGKAAPKAERPITPSDVELGHVLFTGGAKLSASGAACVACHASAAGDRRNAGRLGRDLAQVSARLGGQRGVASWLGNPPTPMMRALYGATPLTPDETHALAAFLTRPSNDSPASSILPAFVLPGALGSLAVLGLTGLAWARRFRVVRQPLVSRMRHYTPSRSRHAPGAGGQR